MEELNQTQENVFSDVTEEEENLFSEEETTESEQNEAGDEGATNETVEEDAPKSFLKVKYNGEDKDLTEDEARTYSQKGMNYDKIYEPLERLARMNGMNVGEYLNQLNTTQFNYEVSKEMDKLREDPKYENLSDEVLEELATNRVTESVNLRDKNYEEQIKGEADAQQAKIQRDLDMFFNEYPEFRDKGPESLDPKVMEYVQNGYTLLEAYNKWARENPQTKVSKLNEENKKKSLGNTTNAGKVDADDFMSGFLNG